MALCTKRGITMNDTATTTGGYKASKMHTEHIPQLLADLEARIGAEHITRVSGNQYAPNIIDSN